MTEQENKDKPTTQADNNSIAVGGINIDGDVNGNITIGNTTGYTSDEVSLLITQITSTFQPKTFDGRCPYKGLDVFEEDDAELFFGREKSVDDLVRRVKESRTVFITGPSGSGKSSLVRAGLIPALKTGTIKNSKRWLYETMKPGRDPIGELARVASNLASSINAEDEIRAKALTDATIFARWCEIALKEGRDKRVVLFIDQFEEVFTQINKEEERAAFLNLLTHAATVENGRVILLFSMRSDFVSNCATYPQLNELLNQQFIQIGAMQPDELVSAMAQPALRVGLRIDPEDLIAQVINDMKGEPGALPLMQFTLKDLFDAQQAKGGMIALTLNDYLKHGGIQKSLERHADAAFAKLGANEQELARSIFSGLIEIGRGTQDTKRTALFEELVPAHAKAEDVQTIVGKLADARLITTDEQSGRETVTISHEKLIDAWPWLKKLVNENRDVIALQNEIAADAKEWEEHNRDPSYLYSGARLATAREKMKDQKLALSGLAQDFVERSIVLQDAERKARETLRRRIIVGLVSGIAIALALAVFGLAQARLATNNAVEAQVNLNIAETVQVDADNNAATAIANEHEAKKQAQISRAGELAAQSVSLREKNYLVSLLLGVEAFEMLDSVQTRSSLLDNTQSNPRLEQFLSGHSDFVTSVAFSPEGKMLASGARDNTLILWDVETRQSIGLPLSGHSDAVETVAFSPDGKTLASGSWDNTVILWDVETRQPIGLPLSGHSNAVETVAFSPDGKTLASGSWDNTVILWDVETHQPIGLPLSGHSDTVESVAFSPDGKMLASGSWDKTLILWDVETRQPIGQPLSGHSGIVWSVAFSPDGKTLASGSNDSTLILWDVETRQPIGQPLREHSDAVETVAFSPEGKMLASGARDNTVILWDVETRQLIGLPLSGHSDFVTSVAFSPDGKKLASGSNDSTLILWDVESHQPIGLPLSGHSDAVESVAFSPDGKTLASGSHDSTLILWDVESHQPIGQPLSGHSGIVWSVAFSPDGKTLASGSHDSTLILWDVEIRQPIGQPLSGHSGIVTSVAFSPDGKTLASGSNDSTVILWDVETRQPIGLPLSGHSSFVASVAFSPDGKTLASGSHDSTVILWDVETRQPIGLPLSGHSSFVASVAFSPDGKTLASGSWDNTVILWDVETRQPIGLPLGEHSNSVSGVAFSPDGKTLASGSWDNTVILWDVETRQHIGLPLGGHSHPVSGVAFSPDGKMLASGSWDNTLVLWDIDPKSWIQKICQRAGRNFTRSEWEQFFHNEDYRKTCDQWDLELEATPTTTP